MRGGTGRLLGGREATYRTDPDGGPTLRKGSSHEAQTLLKRTNLT